MTNELSNKLAAMSPLDLELGANKGINQYSGHSAFRFEDTARVHMGYMEEYRIMPHRGLPFRVELYQTHRTISVRIYPQQGFKAQVAEPVTIDAKTYLYQWKNEKPDKGLAVVSSKCGLDGLWLLQKTFELPQGGLVKIVDENSGEEIIFFVDTLFRGYPDNWIVSNTVRELETTEESRTFLRSQVSLPP